MTELDLKCDYKSLGPVAPLEAVSRKARRESLPDHCDEATPVDDDRIACLYSLLPTASECGVVEILDEFLFLTRTPDLCLEVLELIDLPAVLYGLLARSSLTPSVDARIFAILTSFVRVPGFNTGPLQEILPRKIREVTGAIKTVDFSVVFELLRLLNELTYIWPADWLMRWIVFLRFCVDFDRYWPVVSGAYRIIVRITLLKFATCDRFLQHDFLAPAFRYLPKLAGDGSDPDGRNETFAAICAFLSRMCVNEPRVTDHLPSDFLDLLGSLMRSCNDAQLLSLFKFLNRLLTNLDLIDSLVYPLLVAQTVALIEGAAFAVARAAAKWLGSLMGFCSDAFQDVAVERGSLDFFLRFFETNDTSITRDIFLGIAALSNRLSGSPELLRIFENSEGIVAAVEQFLEDDQHEFRVTNDMVEAAEMFLKNLEAGIEREDAGSANDYFFC
jgi:hypothetical protein